MRSTWTRTKRQSRETVPFTRPAYRLAPARSIVRALMWAILTLPFSPAASSSERTAALAPSPRERAAAQVSFSDTERKRILQLSPLGPVPPDPSNSVADNERAARFGQTLFFETRLSSGGVSCATCHVPRLGFSDGKPVSQGLARGRRNTPSLWNVAYNRWFFWDGRADSLWAQALQPMESETEMGGTRLSVAHLLAGDPALRAGYESVFGPIPDLSDSARFPADGRPVPGKPDHPENARWNAIQERDREVVDRIFVNAGKAIAAYERRLVSRNAPFDRFVQALRAGNESAALSSRAQLGLKLFVGRGNCRVCHGGPNFTDGEFHNTGVSPLVANGPADPGRYEGVRVLVASPFNLLGRWSEAPPGAAASMVRLLRRTSESWGQFKTPSLRNVSRTAPFMHQGQLTTLPDVLHFYSSVAGTKNLGPNGEKILVPLHLSEEESDDLAAFLESLTDESLDPVILDPHPP